MKVFSNGLNQNYLSSILPGSEIDIDWVKAAIAYGNDADTLIKNCLENKRRLDIWMRYDHTVPVAPALLKILLRNLKNNIFCYLIPDMLHAKIIWWRNYGVYIGSANLTQRAWWSNIEVGVFLSEYELEEAGALLEIESIFDSLRELDVAMELSQGIIEEQERIQKARAQYDEKTESIARRLRSTEPWSGVDYIASSSNKTKSRGQNFLREWQQGLTYLEELANMAPDFRPHWLNENVPATWQADQFLHAFYYNKVKTGNSFPYEDFYKHNSLNPSRALQENLQWWKELTSPPSDEDINCHVRAPVIQNHLSMVQLKSLTLSDFIEVCRANHSTADHVRRLGSQLLLAGGLDVMNGDDRIKAFATWIWSQKNKKGETIKDLLYFVLDSGPSQNLPERLFEAASNIERRIPHFGINQFAEIAGWARPNLYPPRNGRTSKALRALGFDVRIY